MQIRRLYFGRYGHPGGKADRFKDGEVVEIREEYDGLGFMQQLGFELKPKEGE